MFFTSETRQLEISPCQLSVQVQQSGFSCSCSRLAAYEAPRYVSLSLFCIACQP